MAKLSEMQRTILSVSTAKKATASDLADQAGSLPGPVVRSVNALIEKGYMAATMLKSGEVKYSRTAEGGKVARSL